MLTSFRRPDATPLSYKTDTELRYIIDNRENYLPESVLGAMEQLKNRGTEFSDEEVRVVEEDMQARMEIAANAAQSSNFFADSGRDLQVEDPDAYVFYSRRVIKAFTFFFSPVFGAILMAMNMSKAKDYAGISRVILFGLGLIIAENIIVAAIGLNASINIIVAFLNAYLIDLLFWDKYIGKATLYKPRSFWVPLIVGLALSALLVVTLMNQMDNHAFDGLLPKNTK
jgi:hypothetical protein